MGSTCTCPGCRHSRGELTDREYAWYLKGCIEVASRVPKSVSDFCCRADATAEERRFDKDIDDESLGDSIMLKEIIEKMARDGEHVDPAFLFPEQYTLPKNEVNDDDERTEH